MGLVRRVAARMERKMERNYPTSQKPLVVMPCRRLLRD
jgi:hypothetical protein